MLRQHNHNDQITNSKSHVLSGFKWRFKGNNYDSENDCVDANGSGNDNYYDNDYDND